VHVLSDLQVEHMPSPCGAFSGQLLLHLEMHMLLGLSMQQLTASIPASCPKAQDVRAIACQLDCSPLKILFDNTSLHDLPLAAAYTGPQLALHATPSVLRPPLPAPLLLGQQPQQQQPQQQQPQQQQPQAQAQQLPQRYTVTPTAQLLTELLPLLTSYCQTQVQQQDKNLQQLTEVLEQQLQHAHAAGQLQADGAQGLQVHTGPADVVSTVKAVASSLCPTSVWDCLQHICALLFLAVVPSPNLTAAEVQAAASAASTQEYTPGQVNYRCVLYAPDAITQNARDILRFLEKLLRHAATWSDTMTQIHVDERVAAAAAAGATAVKRLTAGVFEASICSSVARYCCSAVGHGVTGDFPHMPSALALAALPQAQGQRCSSNC
jgi:hypothetical protein